MNNSKRIISYIILSFVLFVFPLKTFAYVKVEAEPVINSFSLAAPAVNYNVTREYYYVDENDVWHTAKASTVTSLPQNSVITLNNGLMSLDYSSVEYYINNSLYSNSTYTLTGNVTIQEVYHLNRYTITYNLNGGTNNANNPVAYTAESGTITLSAPTRTSATFTGWTWQGQTTPQLSVSFSASDKENKSFTANWQVSTYTLGTGQSVSSLITSGINTVVFGKYSDYTNFTPGTGTNIGATAATDLIYAHTSGSTLYILSDRVISFNADCSQMFYNKSSVTSIVFDNIDTSNVTNMSSMFERSNGLTVLDLSTFDTSSVTNMSSMFTSNGNSSNLVTVYVSDLWDVSSVTNSSNMFKQTRKIVGGNGTTYSNSNTDASYAKVDEPGSPGYFTYKAV